MAKILNDSKLIESQDLVITATQFSCGDNIQSQWGDQRVSDTNIPRSWFHLNHEKNLQVEWGIWELQKDESESMDASRELVFIVSLRTYSRFGSDG